jgi:hypothetical protein
MVDEVLTTYSHLIRYWLTGLVDFWIYLLIFCIEAYQQDKTAMFKKVSRNSRVNEKGNREVAFDIQVKYLS